MGRFARAHDDDSDSRVSIPTAPEGKARPVFACPVEGLLMEETWYSVADVADTLGLSPKTIRKWIRSGELDAWDVGGRSGFRIRKSEAEGRPGAVPPACA